MLPTIPTSRQLLRPSGRQFLRTATAGLSYAQPSPMYQATTDELLQVIGPNQVLDVTNLDPNRGGAVILEKPPVTLIKIGDRVGTTRIPIVSANPETYRYAVEDMYGPDALRALAEDIELVTNELNQGNVPLSPSPPSPLSFPLQGRLESPQYIPSPVPSPPVTGRQFLRQATSGLTLPQPPSPISTMPLSRVSAPMRPVTSPIGQQTGSRIPIVPIYRQ